jgi:hypothetical protein
MKNNQISLRTTLIARILGAVGFLLALASIAGDLISYLIFGEISDHWFLRQIRVDGELNIPTYFSVLLLLFAAQLLAVISVLKINQKAPQVSHWAILSLGFLFMAADEAFFLHDKLNWLIFPLRDLVGNGNLGVFYFAWIIPGIILVFVLGMFFLRFLLRLPAITRLTFLTASILYVVGALGFEMIGARHAELFGIKNLTYRILSTVEESLEMAGVIIFIWALMVYLADNFREIRLRFEGVSFASAISRARSQAVLGNAPDVPELSLDSQFVQPDNQESKVSTSSRDD